MKQFGKILKFEFKNYLQNKIFMGITIFLVAVIAIVMFFPRIMNNFDFNGNDNVSEKPVMFVVDNSGENIEGIENAFAQAFTDYNVKSANADEINLNEEITSGNVKCAFVFDSISSYTYYVNNLSITDTNTMIADEILQNLNIINAMVNSGLSAEDAQSALSVQIEHNTESLGKDQMQNFLYTYIMIFALYMVILLYGQMVASNVANEKSSRAMELLITSAKPVSMMFGKVIASCLAGLMQLVAVFGSALLFYTLNKEYWTGVEVVESTFDIPIELIVYMVIFFILGFLIYAFLFGAVGSTVSKLEDINTAVMPITFLFVAGFMIVIFSMTEGNVDSTLMTICSYIPFTSPMAMFTRIAMSTVSFAEIIISITILALSVIGTGFVSAKIYRVGVLLYGTSPKISNIIKVLRK